MIFISKQEPAAAAKGKDKDAVVGPILVNIEMAKFSQEISQKKLMSNRDTCIIKIGDYLINYATEKKISIDLASLKITDINCSLTGTAEN